MPRISHYHLWQIVVDTNVLFEESYHTYISMRRTLRFTNSSHIVIIFQHLLFFILRKSQYLKILGNHIMVFFLLICYYICISRYPRSCLNTTIIWWQHTRNIQRTSIRFIQVIHFNVLHFLKHSVVAVQVVMGNWGYEWYLFVITYEIDTLHLSRQDA